MARTAKRRQRGITMIETLAATTIVTVALMGAVSIFFGTSTLTIRTGQYSIASNVARRRIEEVRNAGFANTPEGTTVRYYDGNGTDQGTTQNTASQYSATTVVTSDTIVSGVVDDRALRTVVVTVRRLSGNTVMETTGTYLAWGGV